MQTECMETAVTGEGADRVETSVTGEGADRVETAVTGEGADRMQTAVTGEGADRVQTAVTGEVRGDSTERVRAVATATPSEGQTTDGDVCGQARALLCGGRMPVLCPARRLWQKDERVTLPGGLAWPPKGSAAMSADIKLLYTEHTAMTLATAAGLQLHNHKDLLDDFGMLVLPGTSFPAAATPAQKARKHLVDAVRRVAAEDDSSPEAVRLVQQLSLLSGPTGVVAEVVELTKGVPLLRSHDSHSQRASLVARA